MKTFLPLALALFALSASAASALTSADQAALRQLAREYAEWDFSGRPVKFRERLDYESYEEQRGILLLLAERQWSGFWGDYWRKREVGDLKTLRAFSPRDFWLRYHSGLDPLRSDPDTTGSGRVSIDIHAITEARGLAYVIYQLRQAGPRPPNEDALHVLRARWDGREWRLVAFPRITAFLRQQLSQPARRARD
ncbi:MAG: hypothetical protein ABI883_08530 [Chthoniobacterales bacterium]